MSETTTTPAAREAAARLYWLHARTPLHVGSGRGIGFIDLPIMREAVTDWPLVPGSAVKGVLADHYGVTEESRNTKECHRLAFGASDNENSNFNAGSLVFTDAHLVCLPVRSMYGTFAWCASPLALERLRRDLAVCGLDQDLPTLAIPSLENGELQAHVSQEPKSALANGAESPQVFLEDLDFTAVPCAAATVWAKRIAAWAFSEPTWRTLFQERLAVVHDDVFTFLTKMATQVDARVKIDDDTKTVAEGQLWYEESLPAETVLAGLAWCGPVFANGGRKNGQTRSELVEKFCTGPCQLQIGGKATVGRGRIQMTFAAGTGGKP